MIITLGIIITILILLSTRKWNTDFYMESLAPDDKIDLQISIDDEVIFDDTLRKNPFSYPTHFSYPMHIGYHKITMKSNKVNYQKSEEFFLFFNQHIALYYSNDSINRKPTIYLSKRHGIFTIE